MKKCKLREKLAEANKPEVKEVKKKKEVTKKKVK